MKKLFIGTLIILHCLMSNAINLSNVYPWIGFTLHRSKPRNTASEYYGTPKYLKEFYTNPDFGIEVGITKKWQRTNTKKYIKFDLSLGYIHYNLHLFHPDLYWTNGVRYSPAYGYINRNCISIIQNVSYPLNKFLHFGAVLSENINFKTVGDNANHLLYYNGFTDSTGAVFYNSKIDFQIGIEISFKNKRFKIGTGAMHSINNTNMRAGPKDRYRKNSSLLIKIAYNFNSK